MSVIKVKFHHEDSGNCRTTFKEVGKGRYFNRVEHGDFGCWYMVYPSGGYWENSSEVDKDTVFEVLDFDGNTLFTESNGNIGAFSSIGKKADEISKIWEDKLALRKHAEWRKWLLDEMNARGYGGEPDNWLYYLPEVTASKQIGEYTHLGIKFSVVSDDMVHSVCGRKWRNVYILNMRSGCCAKDCGNIFSDDGNTVIEFIDKELRTDSDPFVGGVRQPVFMVKEGVEYFVMNWHPVPEDGSLYSLQKKAALNAAKSMLIANGGKYFKFNGIYDEPADIFKEAAECGHTFTEPDKLFNRFDGEGYGAGFTDFHGNFNEVSAAFHYRIYDNALAALLKKQAAEILKSGARGKNNNKNLDKK